MRFSSAKKKKKKKKKIAEKSLDNTFILTRITSMKKIYRRGNTRQNKCIDGKRPRHGNSWSEKGPKRIFYSTEDFLDKEIL